VIVYHRGLFLFFFFFQAEDGIRDFHVTGVQTCALPIYGEVCHRDFEAMAAGAVLVKPDSSHIRTNPEIYIPGQTYVPCKPDWSRSEERRVGKECRARWSPDQ